MNDELIKQIVTILKDNEEHLSDGYGYYCGSGHVDDILEGIAEQIVSLLTKRPADVAYWRCKNCGHKNMIGSAECELCG